MMEINSADWATIVQLSQFQAGFLARTSHELRSPLSSLMSLHQLILNDLCDNQEEERDCIRQAYEAADRLLKMLELVTYISKLESGLSSLELETISLSSLLEDVRFLTHLQADNRNVKLHIEIPPEHPTTEQKNSKLNSKLTPEFSSDYRILRQVLVCLVESSIFTFSPGTIRLWCEQDVENQGLMINLATTPPVVEWQELKNFSTLEAVTSVFASTLASPLNSTSTFASPLSSETSLKTSIEKISKISQSSSFFSLEYSLMISQILLQRINGQLQLVESSAGDQSFYLQCRLSSMVDRS